MVDRKPHAAIGLGIVCLAAALLLVADDTHGKDAPQGLTAITIRRVHPVLIRNERNALLEVVVDVKRNDEVLLRSLTFALGGTEKLGDLESLELFSTGNKREFVGGTAFGTAAAPAARISFTGNQALQPGANVFWLSCRLKPTASLSRKVGAVCTSIGTTAGKFAPHDPSSGRCGKRVVESASGSGSPTPRRRLMLARLTAVRRTHYPTRHDY